MDELSRGDIAATFTSGTCIASVRPFYSHNYKSHSREGWVFFSSFEMIRGQRQRVICINIRPFEITAMFLNKTRYLVGSGPCKETAKFGVGRKRYYGKGRRYYLLQGENSPTFQAGIIKQPRNASMWTN